MSLDEFKKVYKDTLGTAKDEDLKKIFDKSDKDKSGGLNEAESKEAINEIKKQSDKIPLSQVRILFDKADNDPKDGKISFKEYLITFR